MVGLAQFLYDIPIFYLQHLLWLTDTALACVYHVDKKIPRFSSITSGITVCSLQHARKLLNTEKQMSL